MDLDLDDKRQSSQVVEYLQGPRKKRKNYILMVLGQNFDPDVRFAIQSLVKEHFSSHTLSIPKSMKEFKRLYSRQILLVIIDDKFMKDESQLMKDLLELKKRKTDSPIPLLFLCDDGPKLIQEYHKFLLPYQESDSYLVYKNMNLNILKSKINSALNRKDVRKSRRYYVNIKVDYQNLSTMKSFQGTISDVSIHGASITCNSDNIFREKDQLKIRLPLLGMHSNIPGDYIKLSAKVRRVSLGGITAGISWEYITESQNYILTEYVLEAMSSEMKRFCLKHSYISG